MTMNKSLKIAGAIGILATLPLAHSASVLSQCATLTSEMNQTYPQRVDKVTTILGALCAPGATRPVLIYRMKLDVAKAEIPSGGLESQRSSQLAGWCSDPRTRPILNVVDVKYSYSDRSGVYVGELAHKVEDCPR
jgi:hypothetical protein